MCSAINIIADDGMSGHITSLVQQYSSWHAIHYIWSWRQQDPE